MPVVNSSLSRGPHIPVAVHEPRLRGFRVSGGYARFIGYQGGRLQDLTDPLLATESAAEQADAGGEFLKKRAAELTPRLTGVTASKWRRSDVKRRRQGKTNVFRVDVENPYYKANWLEYGTKAHRIDPKTGDAVNIPAGPKDSVEVRGIRPRHMLATAAAEAEVKIEPLTLPARERWAAEQERLAKSRRGIV